MSNWLAHLAEEWNSECFTAWIIVQHDYCRVGIAKIKWATHLERSIFLTRRTLCCWAIVIFVVPETATS